jgi:benzoyl-CoA reductase/2-hydroxyglutaryl-CoA dehydratase subunit BcrC/BadD/HgdB
MISQKIRKLDNFELEENPRQIDFREWHRLFQKVPEELVENTRYFRDLPNAEWSQYLFPPSTHVVSGNRLLRKLKFDNSLASLRLWGFVMSEGERIYRAKQAGKKVIAVMGDLGAVTPLVYSFPNTVAFYPDCLWWTPFMMESKVLFDEAAKFGLGEDCCFVRAALGAYSKKAYFPKPDLCIGTVGATCDDMNAVMSEVEFLGYDIHYFELPHRHDKPQDVKRLKVFLSGQYEGLSAKLEHVTGHEFDLTRFEETISKVNRMRGAISDLKGMLGGAGSPLDSCVRRNDGRGSRRIDRRNAMGGIEMLNVEFAPLSYYGDLDECIDVIEDVRDTVKSRQTRSVGYPDQDIRLVWVTPPADPQLMNYIEGLGGMIVGSEYLINQTTPQILENGDPFDSLAESHLSGSLMGSMGYRTQLVIDQIEKSNAEGVIISGVFGSSHCPYETTPIVDAVRKKGIPVLAIDVVAPGKIMMQSQIFNRMEAFMESLKAARRYRGR